MESLSIIEANADVVMDTRDATREDWLLARRTGLGGSDAAAAAGFSQWKSPYSLWADKTDILALDREPTEAMKWGNRLEGPIGEAFAEETGITVQRYPKMLRSRRWPHMLVNLDFLTPASVVECKAVGFRMADQWENGAVPDTYQLQGQHACAVTGLPDVYFPVLIGGQELRSVHVDRNDQLIEDLVRIETEFWKLVEDMTPPAADGSDSTAEALKARYGDPAPGSFVEVSPIARLHWDRRAALKAEMKDLKAELQVIENSLAELIGDYETATVEGAPLYRWSKVERGGYEVKPTSFRQFGNPKKS